MPISLLPTPRRIHRTHENFPLDLPVRLELPADTSPAVVQGIRAELEAVFPALLLDSGDEPDATVRFGRLGPADESLEAAPAAVRSQAIRLLVRSQEVAIEAGTSAGWLLGVRLLRGLKEQDELVGLTLLDWPSFARRQLDLPWPAETLSEAALSLWLDLAAQARFNRLGLPGLDSAPLPESAAEGVLRTGIELVPAAESPEFRLMEQPGLFPPYSRALPPLHERALAAEAAGEEGIVVALGALDARTSLEALAYGALFAGDCAWNPRKADLKAHRRWYSTRRFGFDSRGPTHAMDELEAATQGEELAADRGASDRGAPPPTQSPATLAALEDEDPFVSPRSAAILRPDEWAQALERHAAAAMSAMAPLQPDSEAKAAALQGLQWTAQRLRMLARRLSTAERVRQLYRSTHAALASPKAVSDRLLRTADLLESEGGVLEEYRAEWHALWRRERRGPHDEATETTLRAPGERLQALAGRLRELRNHYIRTGTLPSPAELGLEMAATRLFEGILPTRLPPQYSPAWWPEGGEARVRVEVHCPEAAAGMPWPVRVDFRALAGETGAFNVRSARLLPLTETDEAGPERPCQLTRGGFVFPAEAGDRTYFLYLDPLPGPDSGFRETRASQSRRRLRLENRQMQLQLSAEGRLSAWRLRDCELDLLPPEPEEEEESGRTGEGWRLRVLETGPLLARAQAEHPDGRVWQFDLLAGQPWAEISFNTPWSELSLPLAPERWDADTVALFQAGSQTLRRPVGADNGAVDGVEWVALSRTNSLTVAALLPERPVRADVGRGIHLLGQPHGGRVVLYASQEAGPVDSLSRLLEARQQPPGVRLGTVEHRRVREF
jgi:hypothetical protein